MPGLPVEKDIEEIQKVLNTSVDDLLIDIKSEYKLSKANFKNLAAD